MISKLTKFNRVNIGKYKKLLEQTNSSKKDVKEFFQDPAFLELLSSKSSGETQIFYNQKNKYFDLIQKYLDKTITPNVVRAEFIIITESNI